MEWMKLHSDSIGALAVLMLCFVVTIYLLSIQNKSKDGRRITGLFISYVCIHFTGFFADSVTAAQWSKYILLLQDCIVAFAIIYTLWFIYCYRENPFQREMRLILIFSGLLYATALYFQPRSFQWTSLLGFLSFIWIFLVLLHKMVSASLLAKSFAGSNKYEQPIQDSDGRNWKKILVSEFQHPTNRKNKAYRAFALWTVSNIIGWFHIILFVNGISYNYKYWILVHHALILTTSIWLVIAYINYAEEKTTFLAKLVGLFLCLTLFLLGVIGFVLFSAEASTGISQLYGAKTYSGLIEEQQHGLKILAVLIPLATFLIIVVVPFFFRKNLLRPLSYVLQGVKRVNEGDLTKDVHVEINDEIGYLAQSFNHMTESLRTYTNQMESLVAQRTAELQQQKEELQVTLENLKVTQAQLIQSEKMASLGELTAGIAHEIQNPLNFVNNFSEVNKELLNEMENELNADNKEEAISIAKDIKENEEKIIHHGKRADAIVKGMLQHSRVNTGQKEPTDINALTDEYLRLTYHGLSAKDKSFNTTLETNFDESIGKINIIPQDIGRVLLNLYNNAFYAVSEKKKMHVENYEPTVSVSTKKIDSKSDSYPIEIHVKDNGNGIPQKVIDKIFQPFFTTKPTGQGTGLGLSLSYDIIKAHGGEIKVETKEGEGAKFIIQLP
jgi:signal transduction histidine kinase